MFDIISLDFLFLSRNEVLKKTIQNVRQNDIHLLDCHSGVMRQIGFTIESQEEIDFFLTLELSRDLCCSNSLGLEQAALNLI